MPAAGQSGQPRADNQHVRMSGHSAELLPIFTW
jgi:hypothetical protein